GVPCTSDWLVAMTAAISSATLLGKRVVGVQAVKTVASATPAAVTMAIWRRASPMTLNKPPRGAAAGWEEARDTGSMLHAGDSMCKWGRARTWRTPRVASLVFEHGRQHFRH